MSSVLVVGYDPQAVPGVDEQALRAALAKDLARFAEHGIHAAMKTEQLLPLLEQIVNLIRRHAPDAAIAFNSGVGDSLEAAQRLL